MAEPPDRKIVGIEPNAGFDVARGRAKDVHRELDFGRVGKAVAGRFSDRAVKALENNPNVRYVEDDGLVHALAQTLPWGIDRVDADVVHANGETGNGADIAIIDTGIDEDHEDLQANIGEGKDFTGTGHWDDDNGHGTHCAGIADAIDNSTGVVGVSTEATLHAAKVLDSGGSGTWSDVADGIRWVADQGYDVGSLSLGGSSGSSTLKDAVQYAQGKGVLLVGAAGNDYGGDVGYPAAYSEVMAVSSTNENDELSSFSNVGPEIEIAAPGSDIYSTYNDGGYNTLSGTSMATPHVSGAAGQLMANGYTNSEARQQLKDTAEDIGLASEEQGSGLLDAEAAVLGDDGGDDPCSDGVDATQWPDGTGYQGYEHFTQVDMDGQAVESSSTDAYYDFTCPNVVYVEQGGSFDVSIDFEDDGFDSHYSNLYVDWDRNGDWSTATEYQIFSDVSDDTVTYTATIDVPEDAPTGGTLARARLSWNGFDGPSATGEYGEVNDFTVYVEPSSDCVDATKWPDGTGSSGAENIDEVDLGGQVVKSSADNAYEDFTCPDVVTVQPGDSFTVSMDWSDGGYNNHYANVFVDWDQNEDWSTASEYVLMQDVDDDTVTAATTIDVPSDAPTGSTLVRVRLSWSGFDGPSDTGTYGEVNDFTVVVE